MAEKHEDLWKRIDELRGSMSVRELAERSGVNETSLQCTRVNGTLPKLQFLYPIAQTLGTTVEYLYTGTEGNNWKEDRVIKKVLASQLLFDITARIADATPEEVEMVRRMLEVPKPAIMK